LGRIPKSWKVDKFEQFITLQRGHDLPSQSRIEGKVPIYGSNGIVGFHNQSVDKETGVITGRSGSIGDVYFEVGHYWPLNTTLYVKNFHENDKEFTAYYLIYFNLKRFSSGTGVPTLNRNDVHIEVIKFPPIEEQIEICYVLKSIDKQIENKEEKLEKHQSLKKSLMQDLLTGKVRVKVN
jgi:type I restriction enzyme S subunit